MKLDNVKLTPNGGNIIEPASINISVENETVELKFDSSIPVGDAKLHINFEGELNDKLKGFYRSKYTS